MRPAHSFLQNNPASYASGHVLRFAIRVSPSSMLVIALLVASTEGHVFRPRGDQSDAYHARADAALHRHASFELPRRRSERLRAVVILDRSITYGPAGRVATVSESFWIRVVLSKAGLRDAIRYYIQVSSLFLVSR